MEPKRRGEDIWLESSDPWDSRGMCVPAMTLLPTMRIVRQYAIRQIKGDKMISLKVSVLISIGLQQDPVFEWKICKDERPKFRCDKMPTRPRRIVG